LKQDNRAHVNEVPMTNWSITCCLNCNGYKPLKGIGRQCEWYTGKNNFKECSSSDMLYCTIIKFICRKLLTLHWTPGGSVQISTGHIPLHHLAWYKFLALKIIYVFNVQFNNAVSCSGCAASDNIMINKEWSGKDVDASHFSGTSPAVAWSDWGKQKKPAVRTDVSCKDINCSILNMNQR
jgi:hypothetical protein